jgi:DMSO/TMAO reductase YedYZ molybdopterin-dependent catalytic subunit
MSADDGRRRFLVGAGLAVAAPGLLLAGRARAGEATSAGPLLIERTARPYNYESPLDVFTSRITPIDSFYLRNHFDVPQLDPSTWKLSVGGLVDKPLALSLADLEKMPQTTVEAVLQCAGNGRALFQPRMPGVQWKRGAMGNATWTGVRLADLLKRVGPKKDAKHVELQGAERPAMATTPAFIRGIPVDKALHPDTLVALRMNDVPLPRLHGGPARLVVPGWVADDWIKWVERIELRADEPKGFFYEKAYRFPVEPGAPGAPVKDTRTMDRLVVKSVIAAPLDGAVLPPGRHDVKGVAFSGNGKITSVEVSVDGGVRWKKAELDGKSEYGFFVFSSPFDARPGTYEILSRATDASGAIQPATAVWNPSGYLYNAIDGVTVEVRA